MLKLIYRSGFLVQRTPIHYHNHQFSVHIQMMSTMEFCWKVKLNSKNVSFKVRVVSTIATFGKHFSQKENLNWFVASWRVMAFPPLYFLHPSFRNVSSCIKSLIDYFKYFLLDTWNCWKLISLSVKHTFFKGKKGTCAQLSYTASWWWVTLKNSNLKILTKIEMFSMEYNFAHVCSFIGWKSSWRFFHNLITIYE